MLTYGDFSIEDLVINNEYSYFQTSEYENSYITNYDVTVQAFDGRLHYMADCNVEYIFVDDQWICRYINTTNSTYMPDYMPGTESLEETLLEDGYTQLSLFETEEDWENLNMTLCYEGIKEYDHGKETYRIYVDCFFELDEENHEYGWNYNSNEIDAVLFGLDWDLQGLWSASNKENPSGYVEYDISLDIIDDHPNNFYYDGENQTFTISATSNADVKENLIWKDKYYSCVSSGESYAKMSFSEDPGEYNVSIVDKDGSIYENIYRIYMGVPHDNDEEYRSGIYWTGGGSTVELIKQE